MILFAQADPVSVAAMEAARALGDAQTVQQFQQAAMILLFLALAATVVLFLRREKNREEVLEARRVEERDYSRAIVERVTVALEGVKIALEKLGEKEAPR